MLNKYIIFVLFYLLTSYCVCQIQTFNIEPNKVDEKYSSEEESNYIVRNTSVHLNKLVLFIGGSFSKPGNYSIFCKYPASLGFDVVSLSYPNNVAAAQLDPSSDSLIFDKYRQELCFGTAVSGAVSVDTLNSIYTRTLKLIQYLSTAFPLQNWGQYLATPSTLDWRKIIVAGHSQGSGHACFLAKHFSVDRVVMFSGPNDFSTFYNNSANWLRKEGVTPVIKHFALLNIKDEIVPFSNQLTNLKGLGMLQNDDSTLVDNLSFPYANSHFLYTKIPAISYHNSTIGGNSTLPPVWNYMLTSSISTGIGHTTEGLNFLKIHPNPANSYSIIEISNNTNSETLNVFNSAGQLILAKNVKGKSVLMLDISKFANGLYYVKVGKEIVRFLKN